MTGWPQSDKPGCSGSPLGRDNPLPFRLWGLDLRGVCIMETAFKA